MAGSLYLFLYVVINSLLSVAGSYYCYYYTSLYSGLTYYYCYYYYSSYSSVGAIIGAVVGGIVGLIVLCVVSVIICVVCCKRKPTPGTIIHPAPAGVTAITSASNNTYYNYPQHHQGWGLQPSAPYPGQQHAYPPPPPPPPVSQPMPPPAYAENVITGQPPQHTI